VTRWVAGQAHELIQIYSNTDYCLIASCTLDPQPPQLSGICLCVASDSPDFDTSNGGQPARIGDQKHNRGDCGWPTKVITGCPGEIACSAHGVCAGAPEYRCTCSVGYGGADCSEFVCASSPAWFDAPIAHNVAHQLSECANMGHCDRTKGTCMCMLGFEGGSCNRMSCPGEWAPSGMSSLDTYSYRVA
jgi:hypothetical protein